MKAVKKILIALLSLALLLFLLNIGLSYWVKNKLPSLIRSDKDFPYNVSYKDVDISLLNGSFIIHNAYIAPKDTTSLGMQRGAYASIKKIEVEHFNLWALLRKDQIKVEKVILDTPGVTLFPREKKYNTREDVKPFKNTILTQNLEIRNGNFRMLDSLQNITLKASNINFDLYNIKVDSATIAENIPVRYTDYAFKCDSLFYRAGIFYNLTLDRLTATDSSLTAESFRMIPQQTRKKFNSMIPEERDQFNISAKSISIPKTDWGYISDTLYVHLPELILEEVNANIYRGKMVKDDFTTKKMYSEMLRSLDFDLKVDKLLLKKSFIQYEEQLEYSRPPAKVSFSGFYATIYNIYSPVNKKELPRTLLDVQCLFMKKAPLNVKWSFNSLNTNDAFSIQGFLQDVNSQDINPVSQPLMNVTTNGKIKEVAFSFNGNKDNATGTFAIKYDDLKVELYKKDGKEKNKFMTFVGNLLVKNDSKGERKETRIETERVKHKSFFNFLWRCVQDGLKQTLLPKIITGGSKDKKKKEK